MVQVIVKNKFTTVKIEPAAAYSHVEEEEVKVMPKPIKQQQKKKTQQQGAQKNFSISTQEAHHVQPLLQKLIEAKPNWRETTDKMQATLRWMNPGVPD